MEKMIQNFINGNLTDAKKQAERFSQWKIREALQTHGYSLKQATLTADWLKGRDCYQAMCDENAKGGE
jgi:hypothetical protein